MTLQTFKGGGGISGNTNISIRIPYRKTPPPHIVGDMTTSTVSQERQVQLAFIGCLIASEVLATFKGRYIQAETRNWLALVIWCNLEKC